MPSTPNRAVILASLVMLVSALGTLPAQASCAEAVPLQAAIANARTVFVGTVTETDFDGRVATFNVGEVWKGETSSMVIVVGGPSLAELQAARSKGEDVVTSVDRSFELGTTYLVVSHGSEDGVLLDNQCSNTQPFAVSLNEYRPDATPPTTAPPVSQATRPTWAWAALSGGALALAAGTYVVARAVARRHRSRPQATQRMA